MAECVEEHRVEGVGGGSVGGGLGELPKRLTVIGLLVEQAKV